MLKLVVDDDILTGGADEDIDVVFKHINQQLAAFKFKPGQLETGIII